MWEWFDAFGRVWRAVEKADATPMANAISLVVFRYGPV